MLAFGTTMKFVWSLYASLRILGNVTNCKAPSFIQSALFRAKATDSQVRLNPYQENDLLAQGPRLVKRFSRA